METHSDFNKFPHRVFVSVILLKNKIVNWKVGNLRWTKDTWHFSRQPGVVIKNEKKIKIFSRSFLVNNSQEHNKAFEVRAKQFLKKFKIHPKYIGMRPY